MFHFKTFYFPGKKLSTAVILEKQLFRTKSFVIVSRNKQYKDIRLISFKQSALFYKMKSTFSENTIKEKLK